MFAERYKGSLQREEGAAAAFITSNGSRHPMERGIEQALSVGISQEPHRPEPPLYPIGSTIFLEVERFTSNVITTFSGETFDIIHTHDWMTFPAGVALSQLTGKPLIVHVHSLEQDRSGLFVDRDIEKIEKLGLETASRVIAVSHYTQRAIERFHGISRSKIRVIHNGVYPRQAVQDYQIRKTWPRNVVLFLGRVTFQKGPDYFVEVAARVIPQVPGVLFVLAGTGDMLPAVKQQVAELGLNDYFMFPGFVSGEELEEMFSVADLYVMPSVSEPFGITALEAISFDTPVIISKQSGVSEVLEHALKVDFWDLDRMAHLIISVLLNQELRAELVQMAKEEVKHLHWDAAAAKTIEVYQELLPEVLTNV
jgi:glycosyltransferase involved in cell wall biosynthesis